MAEPTRTYIEPTEESGRALFRRGIAGPILMLNLIRLRPVADYSASPALAPPEPVSGAAAFDRYVSLTLPFLRASGGELLLLARGGNFFIGPPHETWDIAMLVRQSSLQAFFAFAADSACLEILGHRTAAVADSRLLPLEETARPAS